MEKFLLIVREELEMLSKMTDEQRLANIREMSKWAQELTLSGNYIMGEPLRSEGTYVSKDQVPTDGPFIEAKEAVSGFLMIYAENLNQAISIAQSCPKMLNGDLTLEVRPIFKFDNE